MESYKGESAVTEEASSSRETNSAENEDSSAYIFDEPTREGLTDYQLSVTEVVNSYCASAAYEVMTRFWKEFDALVQYRDGGGEKIREYLREKGLDCPKFKLRFGESAKEMLRTLDLKKDWLSDSEIERGVLLFQLPKPLAQYWRKGIGEWGEGGVDVSDQPPVIPWGTIYRGVMQSLWDMETYWKEDKGLVLDRINRVGEHDSAQYYYVWLLDPED